MERAAAECEVEEAIREGLARRAESERRWMRAAAEAERAALEAERAAPLLKLEAEGDMPVTTSTWLRTPIWLCPVTPPGVATPCPLPLSPLLPFLSLAPALGTSAIGVGIRAACERRAAAWVGIRAAA